MTARKNLDELMTVLENIRTEKYPDVPHELVEKIAFAQYDNQDDRAKARAETMRIVGDYLNTINEKEN